MRSLGGDYAQFCGIETATIGNTTPNVCTAPHHVLATLNFGSLRQWFHLLVSVQTLDHFATTAFFVIAVHRVEYQREPSWRRRLVPLFHVV